MSDIKQKIHDYIVEFITYGDPIGDDESLLESGRIDSTGAMECIMFMEETFNVIIADEDVDPSKLDTINLMTALVESKLKEAA